MKLRRRDLCADKDAGKDVDDLISYKLLDLKFDGNLVDSSPYNRTITGYGNPLFEDEKCIILDGASQQYTRIYPNWVNIYKGNVSLNDCTIEAWFFPYSSQTHYIFSNSGQAKIGEPVYHGYNFYVSGQNLAFQLKDSNTISTTITTSSTGNYVILNSWNHLAAVIENGIVCLFINGILRATKALTAGFRFNSSTSFNGSGCLFTNGNSVFSYSINGKIDDLRVYVDVAKYTEDFSPPARGKY